MTSEIRQNPTTRARRLTRTEKREQERTARQERAAWLVAEDEMSDEKIAQEIGIHRDTLFEWKKIPEFKARVAEHVAQITHQVMHSGYCRVDKRLALLNRNVNRLEAIIGAKADLVNSVLDEVGEDLIGAAIEAAGEDDLGRGKKSGSKPKVSSDLLEEATLPGADQGLYFRKETPVKFGTQVEYTIGIAVLAEERATLKHIAVETGDWIERISGNISLDSALAGLLGKVGTSEEEASPGDSSDLATETSEGV